jgi:predicted nucleic acid-binding protein
LRHVVLDTGVLGLLAHTSKKSEPRKCKEWMQTLLRQEVSLYVPEIADYELRRELLRMDLTRSIARLDALKAIIGYLRRAIVSAISTVRARLVFVGPKMGPVSSMPSSWCLIFTVPVSRSTSDHESPNS